jgi:hypothetical protein
MRIAVSRSRGYWTLDVRDRIGILDGVDILRRRVSDMLSIGYVSIAVRFIRTPTLSSRSIAVVIKCNEMVRRAGGEFAVMNGGDHLETYLHALGLTERFCLLPAVPVEADGVAWKAPGRLHAEPIR